MPTRRGAAPWARVRREAASVTIADRSSGRWRAAPRGGRHAAPATAAPSRLPASLVAVIASCGVLLVAAAYTAGRLGHASSSWADRTYWAGQALILVPVAVRLLGRRFLAAGETVTLIAILTVAEYVVRACYSPAAFTYADELEHWRSTVDILQTGSLFTGNNLLPISPHYPGLEEATSALVSVTGLSVFASGLIVAGVAHLLFVCVLYVIFREVSGSYRIAGIAVLCYASNSLFVSFDSMFVYQTLALAFFGLTLLAARRLAAPETAAQAAGWCAVAVLAIAATVVTHHVTSYALVAALVVIALADLLTRNWRTAAWAAVLALLSAAAAIGWLVFVAPGTSGYLRPVAEQTWQSIRTLLAGAHTSAPPAVGPLSNKVLAAAAVLAVSALLPAGWRLVWRRYRRRPWNMAMAIGSVSWYLIVAVRLTVADGSELAGRAATFVFVPIAYVIALAVGHLASAGLRKHAQAMAAAALVIVLLLLFNELANGWPPYWERLPGPYQVAGSERSVEPAEIAAARWTLAALGPGNNFATDIGSYPVLGSYGDQNPLRNVGYLYDSPALTQSAILREHAQSLRYVLVDQRLSQSLPAYGRYFPVDPKAGKYSHPLAAAGLGKFNSLPGVDRIYDSGDIVIYRLAGG